MTTALDPIVSLSVALAEAPGTTAILIGSGVSRDAGIPTGWEIMREGLRRLMQLEWDEKAPPPSKISDDDLDAWLSATGRRAIDYPQLLELIAPDPATRRAFLAGFFDGKEPGRSHHLLAGLAQRGLVKVFVTTNFDRLLEQALESRGIQPTVVSSDADLDEAEAREHARCFVLKPHGDYLRLTIRNTPDELDQLPNGLQGELAEIFARHSLLVLGYSGSDPAIVRTLQSRRSRYGLWWLSRGTPTPATSDLLARLGGRVIRRATASEFLTDLDRRIRVFEQHPTGLTPAVIHDETLALLRNGDVVGLDELLRVERQQYEHALDADRTEGFAQRPVTPAEVAATWARQYPAWHRRLASLLPVGLHRPELFDQELSRMASDLGRQPLRGGYSVWINLGEVGAAVIGYQLGATLLELDRHEALHALLTASWSNVNGYAERLVDLMGEPEHQFGQALAPPVATSWLSPAWKWLTHTLNDVDWFDERYPEVVVRAEEAMARFDLILAIHRGLNDEGTAAWFTFGPNIETYARTINKDPRARAGLATAVGLTLAEFDARAPEALRKARGWPGSFTTPASIAALLEHGIER